MFKNSLKNFNIRQQKFGLRGPFMIEKIPHIIGTTFPLKCGFGIGYNIDQFGFWFRFWHQT